MTIIALTALAATVLLAQPMGIGFATGGSCPVDDGIVDTGTVYYSGTTLTPITHCQRITSSPGCTATPEHRLPT